FTSGSNNLAPTKAKMTRRLPTFVSNNWLLLGLAILCAGLYLANIGGWLMHDDEGTDFYEIWRLAEGEQPGIDFLAEQQPLYLLSGSFLLTHSRNPVPILRGFAAVQVLAASFVLALVVNRIWGQESAILSLGLLLGCGMLYEQARLFRPDPMMFAWEVGGLAAVLTAVHHKKRWLWSVAGACIGLATLWKLFGIFPVVGLVFFFSYWLIKEKETWREIIICGLYFSLPFLLVAAGGSAILYGRLGFYYGEAFTYHLEANQNSGLLIQSLIVGGGYLLFLVSNAIFIFILPLRFLNRRLQREHGWATAVLLTQLLSPILFLAITRPIHLRYYLFLLPTLAILLAVELQLLLKKMETDAPQAKRFAPLLLALVIATGWVITQPQIANLLRRQEGDTLSLARLVAERTAPDDVVVSDYAGINFFAKRPSIYEATIIAGAQIASGSVTGTLLIERIEETDAQMVLVHVAGGEPTPHQLVNLVDYPQFRAYLESRFQLTTIFERAGQQIEVFERK
ncbi:MAG: glycosyltransferase family 39 protein, partial [Ardenticatenaceae bacterium]|nr:glycosyltransferase family 39 protein [Ardenticatenaceae bacterium]